MRVTTLLLALLVPSSVVAFSVNRREWIQATTAVVPFALSNTAPAIAAPTTTTSWDDRVAGFTLQVPSSWTPSEQTLSDRRTLKLWMDPTDSQTFLFIAYTPVRDDFTSLGSFGSVDQVAAQTILPKGSLAGQDGVSARMLQAKSERQAYFFDYQQQVPGVPLTHLRTIFALQQGATGGAGAVLVTITAQTPEARYGELQPLLDQIMESYAKV